MSYCAPGGGSQGSCFSLRSLRKIANSYNQSRGVGEIKNIQRKNKKQLVQEISERMSHVCPNEWCWIDQDFVRNLNDPEIQYLTFRPRRPKGKYDWLATDNIAHVMSQYEHTYP